MTNLSDIINILPAMKSGMTYCLRWKCCQSTVLTFVMRMFLYVLWNFLLSTEFTSHLKCHWKSIANCIWHCCGRYKRKKEQN